MLQNKIEYSHAVYQQNQFTKNTKILTPIIAAITTQIEYIFNFKHLS